MLENLDDTALIKIIMQGNHTAYTVILQRYEQYVFSIVAKYVDSREVAEELAQDVFMKAFRFLGDFKGGSKFSTWLYTIANTTCLTYLRKRKDEPVSTEPEKLSLLGYSETLNPGELKSQKALIDKAMKMLPPEDARIITFFYLAEQSMDEIGIILGITPANVKVKLFRARQKLREVMEKHFKKELV